MDVEEWRSIRGYPGYEASSLGNIRNAKTLQVKKGDGKDKNGYRTVWVQGNPVKLARLVASAFIPDFDIHDQKVEIDHIDRDKLNNKPTNLRMADDKMQSSNRDHSNAARGKKCPVEQLDLATGQVVQVHESVNAAARATGSAAGNISRVLAGKAKQTGGFGWRYKTGDNVADLPGEEWRPFGNVHVSNKGRIKRPVGTGFRIQEVHEHSKKTGYPTTMIQSKSWAIHRLVAHVFLGGIKDKDRVHHKDGDYMNPASDNLAVATRREIARATEERGRKRYKITVVQYEPSGALVRQYPSIRAAAEATGIDSSFIGKCVRGVFPQAGGFVWRLG